MQTLVICNDYWHPAQNIRTGLYPLGRQGFEFDWIENANDWSAVKMDEYPVGVLTKSNETSATDKSDWVTPVVEQALLSYVQQGNGLLVIHSGSAGYYGKTYVLRDLLGGLFTHHPDQCDVTVEPKKDHPLTAGCESFTLKDEHYFMDVSDPQVDVFLTTSSQHGTQPGGWTRTEGEGRVCVLTPGHNVEVWLHPSYQALIQNALNWCGKII